MSVELDSREAELDEREDKIFNKELELGIRKISKAEAKLREIIEERNKKKTGSYTPCMRSQPAIEEFSQYNITTIF